MRTNTTFTLPRTAAMSVLSAVVFTGYTYGNKAPLLPILHISKKRDI